MKLLSKIQDEYEQLWKSIVRPTRSCYPLTHLGPDKFHLEDVSVMRQDFQLTNSRGYVFFCSLFSPADSPTFPCVVFSHGNSSNRIQGMEYLGKLIRNGLALCTFDFSGCGNAEGDYVSLGYYEQHDLALVVNHLQHNQHIPWVALYGRSMGAVASLLYLHTYQQPAFVRAMVLDSPFKSLKALIQDIVKKNSKVPMFIVSGALKIIANTIEEKALFDITKINPLKNDVAHLTTPAMFIVGNDDQIIPPTHTIQLCAAYAAKIKACVQVKGKHNDSRSDQCIENAIKFILKTQNHQETLKQQIQININDMQINQNIENNAKEEFQFFGKISKIKKDPYEDVKHIIEQNIQHLERKDKNRIRKRRQRQQKQAFEDDSLSQIQYNIRNWSY